MFAENEGPPPPWHHSAFALIQDTPFRFESPADLSCAANRGPEDASLLLVNHWITRIAPDRVQAAKVNTRAALLDRAALCEQERGRMPNYLAVDFSTIGDLTGAVDTLNGTTP